jgi:hypothetical protein
MLFKLSLNLMIPFTLASKGSSVTSNLCILMNAVKGSSN